jgi:hypothetical protein
MLTVNIRFREIFKKLSPLDQIINHNQLGQHSSEIFQTTWEVCELGFAIEFDLDFQFDTFDDHDHDHNHNQNQNQNQVK